MYPELLYLEAAKGWYMLGNLKEADAQLDQLPQELRLHPDVLEVRFMIYSRSKKWEACMDIATALLGTAPERPNAWIYSATVLHAYHDTRTAWEILFHVQERFPDTALIPYFLACYACALGKLEEAVKLAQRAFRLGGREMLAIAREDADLKPIWSRIADAQSAPDDLA